NPADAIFLTMDTERNGGDLRATLSLYGYTEGDPINKIDPSGHIAFVPFLIIGGKKLGGAALKKGGAALARRAAARGAQRAAQRAAQRRAQALARQRARAAAQRRAQQAAQRRAQALARQRAREEARQRAREAARRRAEAQRRAQQQAAARQRAAQQQRAVANRGCFVAGTLVKAKDGHVPIEQIRVGDYVYAKDPKTGEVGLRPVTNIFRFESYKLIRIEVGEQKIHATPYHPFYVPEQGWTSAGRLSAGDELLLNCGEVIAVYRVQLGKTTTAIAVYNFEVEGKHTYFVSSLNVLVHNKPAGQGSQNIERVGRQKGKAPRNNQRQNEQAREVARRLSLSARQREALHRAMRENPGLDFQGLLNLARNMFR
ncbi:MAG: polymorphic toxin-type HINT domain-containing protein, partial [Coriobacteriia bacterium]|nr:polymorphic toxin-type HINT domain-containing protein [Coriobacteriia bacterium]